MPVSEKQEKPFLMAETVSRLAPSPTGALHLGNLRTFLANYLLACRQGWKLLMRVEDIDGPRIKAGAAEAMLADLAWLGLDWVEPVVWQSHRMMVYESALARLVAGGQAYPCVCSRKDALTAAAAPHAEDGVFAYPGTCRGVYASGEDAASRSAGRPVAWRVKVEPGEIEVADRFAGPRKFDLARTCGDFVIYRGEQLPSYQLAVVVDDAEAGVDAIVRGEDLLESAARQIHLRRLLGLSPEPGYWHLPLVVGPDGRRLAKRHGDTRLATYSRAGATPQRVLGLLAAWLGLADKPVEMSMADLLARFDIDRVPREKVVFTAENDRYLRGI
jgi:glutamyl-tRNA synthetase